ncbi:dolichyl-P-Man:Man(7)GlcNAc(2)-PP-dolichol alpha-1,6-mannosyltransferase [Blomia tropicalis]|nr:dolichyl-P-Man:Man(7)GlcNAc(2)-PP-dolichol alpha-1,6-mannosyltransferase [Blomia tropicalis]
MFTFLMSTIDSILIWAVAVAYIWIAPHTKVEESFSIQAIHDYLFLSRPVSKSTITNFINSLINNFNETQNIHFSWDHESFPGFVWVVRRTFISPFIISLIAYPFKLLNLFEDKFYYQILVRICLVTLFVYSYKKFHRAISIVFGSYVSKWLTLISLTQFHYLFYASRTLPNTFALICVQLIYSTWLLEQWNQFIILIAFTVLVIRFETIILFGCIILYEIFYTRKLSITRLLTIGIPSGILWLIITVPFDSYMWNRWTWPEGDGIWFNIVENRSHEWGTQPFFWYFYSVLPKFLLFSSIFATSPVFYRNKFAFVTFSFILLYSLLPHKELRFIIYTVPLLNLCVANRENTIFNRKMRDGLRRRPISSKHLDYTDNLELLKRKIDPTENEKSTFLLCKRFILKNLDKLITLIFILNFTVSFLMLYISSTNYPGGKCIRAINQQLRVDQRHNISHDSSTNAVYVSNLAAQSGFTRFLQLDDVYYGKAPQFEVNHFQSYSTIYLALETGEEQKYFTNCSLANGSKHQMTCQLNGTNGRTYKCDEQQNVTAFDRIDFKQLKVNYRTFLNVYKCIIVATVKSQTNRVE